MLVVELRPVVRVMRGGPLALRRRNEVQVRACLAVRVHEQRTARQHGPEQEQREAGEQAEQAAPAHARSQPPRICLTLQDRDEARMPGTG